jgi:hypothetical protein
MDSIVRHKLRSWPQQPPGLADCGIGGGAWLRGRPGQAEENEDPYLKLPGSNRLRTVPDGLWLCFGGTERDPFVDLFVIEACGTFTNLLDKRFRFAPSMHSMLAVCPVRWLLGKVSEHDRMPRWQRTGLLRAAPTTSLTLPVRDIRVMYALKPSDYEGFVANQVPHAHEFFAPITALIGPEGWRHPTLRAFIARNSPRANFWEFAGATAA